MLDNIVLLSLSYDRDEIYNLSEEERLKWLRYNLKDWTLDTIENYIRVVEEQLQDNVEPDVSAEFYESLIWYIDMLKLNNTEKKK